MTAARPETRVERQFGAPISTIELRDAADASSLPVMTGYSARFNSASSVLGGYFIETIARDAFNGTDMSDVCALFNHDASRLLGRTTNNTLRLSIDDMGLRYEVDMDPDDADCALVMRKLKRGALSGASFAFTVADDDWTQRDDGVWLRTINAIGTLFDVGPVTYPAYPAATSAMRGLADAKDQVESYAAAQRAHEAQQAAEARRRRIAALG